RLWSSPALQDENDMYLRLSQAGRWLAQSAGSLHQRQQDAGFLGLFGPDYAAALHRVAEVLEPAHYYHRLHEKSVARQYHNQAALDHLADYLPAENETFRQLSQSLHQPEPAVLAQLATQLQ